MSPQLSAPYGSWPSPITSEMIVADTVRLGQICLRHGHVFWIEGRPWDSGRAVLVQRSPGGQIRDVTPAPYNVRSRVHEYGGGAYTVLDGHIVFSNLADQRLYWQPVDEARPTPITAEGPFRYADPVHDPVRQRLIVVREDHSRPNEAPVNTIVSLPLTFHETMDQGTVLVSGHDFYSNPRVSPDGAWLAWLAWNHPNMPWDSTELWMARLTPDGRLAQPARVAGGHGESIFQPAWSPTNQLYCVSDRTGWWNLYRIGDGALDALLPMDAEFGLPQWAFGFSTYAFASAATIVCTYSQNGTWRLGRLETHTRVFEPIPLPYTEIEDIRAEGDDVLCRTSSPTEPPSLIHVDMRTRTHTVIRRSMTASIPKAFISIPESIAYTTRDGGTAHAFFYAPTNPHSTAPDHELPPLIVKIHGGPTGACGQGLNFTIQYWTSRGIAVLDVNYRGSTGYGRAYREHLHQQWGIVDVHDCLDGVTHLAREKRVDEARTAITGGSAGGFTALCALVFHETFSAGSSYYGVSDLATLARDTHKFESRYLEWLVGTYPEARARYDARSPLHHADQLSCPLILFQGQQDEVVPPSQAEHLVSALLSKQLPVAYLTFPDEQHGFRRSDTIKAVLEAELYFYSRIFTFTPADTVEAIPIANLPA